MDYEDFFKYFSRLIIVHTNVNNFDVNNNDEEHNSFKWSCIKFDGTIQTNEFDDKNLYPQYFISLKEQKFENEDNKITLFVSLLQKNGIQNRLNNYGQYNYKIVKISIYKVCIDYCTNKLYHEKFDLYDNNTVKLIFESGKI